MADRYEEKAREIACEHYGAIAYWPPGSQTLNKNARRLAGAIAAALREQDAWWPIDDKEHPAPRDGTELIGLGVDTNIFRIWRGHTGRGTPAWVSFGGPFTDGYIVAYRPLPAPPPDTGRGHETGGGER